MQIKYFIGPMSKNIVDSIVEFSNENNVKIGLIPSRRQIEYNGGYVNNWKTLEFSTYVREKSNNIIIQRDHGGPQQGQTYDNGYESLQHDVMSMDLIHIDPWKEYRNLNDGILETVNMIQFCDNLNPNLKYEIGTEQSIRHFDVTEVESILTNLKNLLKEELFNKIVYTVIQSGTSLKGNEQTGSYDKNRLIDMVKVVKKFGKLSKEHNGDYISVDVINEKFQLGLDAINIAPEFGLIETNTYLTEFQLFERQDLFDMMWKICFDSKKWVKWVDSDFDPISKKIELVKICGHYILSNSEFVDCIKSKLPDIDSKIKINIKNKLNELYSQR